VFVIYFILVTTQQSYTIIRRTTTSANEICGEESLRGDSAGGGVVITGRPGD